MTPTGKQIRAARALAGWDRKELAEKAGVSHMTLQYAENGERTLRPQTIEKVINTFHGAGIEFTEGQGVRFKANDIEVFEGTERFEDFTEFVYSYLKHNGGDVCISAFDERKFLEYRKNPELYRSRMKKLVDSGSVTVRILATKSSFRSAFAKFKWQPNPDNMTPTSFYAFGDCLALISFAGPSAPYVVLHKSGPFAEAYRTAFEDSWENAENPPIKQDHTS